MTNGPVSDVRPGSGFVGLIERLACFIRSRMLVTQLLDWFPTKAPVNEEATGLAKESPGDELKIEPQM